MKYLRLINDLETTSKGTMKCFGNSMTPILSSGCLNYYKKQSNYEIGDIVFCKVKGRFVDAHLITKKQDNRFLISNNHGHDNGWTSTIYGKVIKTIDKNKNIKEFK